MKPFFADRTFAAFLYDFDGTIADTMGPHLSAWNAALAIHGLELTLRQHLDWAGRPTREIVGLLAQLHGHPLDYEEISRAKEVSYLGSLASVKPIVPVVDIIRANHGRVPQVIVTGSRRRVVETTLAHLDLRGYFDFLVCAEDYVNGKPAPDCFLTAASRLHVPPADCLVFEDAALGVEAAHAAGMSCVRVTEHPDSGHQLNRVDVHRS